jgi:menaquinone-specific isochorismate synthase
VSVPAPCIDAESLLDRYSGEDAFFWSPRAEHERVAIGVARRFQASGAQRFSSLDEQVQRLWQELEVDSAVSSEGPRPVLLGGSAFQAGRASAAPWTTFGEAQLVLPRWLYTRIEREAWLSIAVSGEELRSAAEGAADWLLAARVLLASTEGEGARSTRLDELPLEPANDVVLGERSAEEWQALVEAARSAIGRREFDKVVAARRVSARAPRVLSPSRTLARLRAADPEALRFAFRVAGSTFIGSPPERLLVRRGAHIETEAVAGSVLAKTPRAVELLLDSAKLRAEHTPVVQDLVLRLQPYATLSAPDQPKPHRARDIIHLKTPISGTLREPVRSLRLLAAIHPTPAVGGYPTGPALNFIAANEPDERGWYAGPVGWLDAEDDAEFAVALRSGVLVGDTAHIYVGAGIVRDSDPMSELEETRWKLNVFLKALEGL